MEDSLNLTLKNSCEQGQLRPDHRFGTVNTLHASPNLSKNVKDLCRLQEMLPGMIAKTFRAKKKGSGPMRMSWPPIAGGGR